MTRNDFTTARLNYLSLRAAADVLDDRLEAGEKCEAEWEQAMEALDQAEEALLLLAEAVLAHLPGAGEAKPAYDAALGRDGRHLSVATRWRMLDIVCRLDVRTVDGMDAIEITPLVEA